MNKLIKARARMLINNPFFGTLVMSTPMIEDNTIPTAATDMTRIYYNAAFIEGLPMAEVEFVLAHEVLHMALEHGVRRGVRNAKKWNHAADYAGNLILKESGFTLWPKCLVDEKYVGMSADQIYDILEDDGAEDPMGQDLREPENSDPEAVARARQTIRERISQAATMARMSGKLSGGLERLVNGILNPKAPWQALLRDYMTRTSKDDENWSRRNRRFSTYLPARYSQRMGEVVIIGDTSGSIGEEELNQVAAEVQAIVDSANPECIRVIWADAEVTHEETFQPGDKIVFHPKGGGGTDMRVPLEHVEQFNPEVVILATDGYTPWPNIEPPYPLIVCCSTNADVPIGYVVRL